MSYIGKRVKVLLSFTHLDHDKGINLDAGNDGEDGEGCVGGDRDYGGVGEENHHGQSTGEY